VHLSVIQKLYAGMAVGFRSHGELLVFQFGQVFNVGHIGEQVMVKV